LSHSPQLHCTAVPWQVPVCGHGELGLP
jgi:hypothetical protein